MSALRSAGRAIRDAWLMLGIALLGLVVLEAAYQVARGERARPSRGGDSAQHPYAGQEWWSAFRPYTERVARPHRFDAYRGYWASRTRLPGLTVDSAGRRLTVQPSGARRRVVYLLGGSTMWGYTARDSFTIPSLAAAALARRGIHDVDVVNLAQTGYNSTQELNTLILELLRGGRPVVAVVLNGVNDIVIARDGMPAHTYLDGTIDQQIALGKRGFWQELAGLGRHSAVVQRLRKALGPRARPAPPGPNERHCGRLADYYRQVTRVAEAVAAAYGVTVIYFLQPAPATSRKPRSAWEQQLVDPPALGPCMTSFDSAMADRRGVTFHSLAGVFDTDTATMFVDEWGHLTEAANRKVAERLVEVIAPLLKDRP